MRTGDPVGKQWPSGIEAVEAGCETAESREADRGHGLLSYGSWLGWQTVAGFGEKDFRRHIGKP